MKTIYLKSNGYLFHHGIEGQKWGVRRWQNKDGSLTAEGRIHYGIDKLPSAKYEGDDAKKAYKQERRDLMYKIHQINNEDQFDIDVESADRYGNQYAKDRKNMLKKYGKRLEETLGTDPNKADWFDVYESLHKDGSKFTKEEATEILRYLDDEPNPDAWDYEWEEKQTAISDSAYKEAEREINKYLTSKYGEEVVGAVAKSDKAKVGAAAIGTILATIGLVGIPIAYLEFNK